MLRISIIQTEIKKGDVKHNFVRLKEMIENTGATDVVVAPELALTGYVDDYAPLRESITHAVEEIKRMAKSRGFYVIVGLPLYENRDVYNAAIVFSPDGGVSHIYKKIHLFPLFGEEEKFKRGTLPDCFVVDDTAAGIIICYDLRFPELVRYYALKGARVIFNLAMWPEARFTHQYTLARARAIENQVFVITCNATGGKFSGKSHVFRPDGEPVLEAPQKEGIFHVELDEGFVEKWRKEFPSLSRVRKDIDWCHCE